MVKPGFCLEKSVIENDNKDEEDYIEWLGYMYDWTKRKYGKLVNWYKWDKKFGYRENAKDVDSKLEIGNKLWNKLFELWRFNEIVYFWDTD